MAIAATLGLLLPAMTAVAAWGGRTSNTGTPTAVAVLHTNQVGSNSCTSPWAGTTTCGPSAIDTTTATMENGDTSQAFITVSTVANVSSSFTVKSANQSGAVCNNFTFTLLDNSGTTLWNNKLPLAVTAAPPTTWLTTLGGQVFTLSAKNTNNAGGACNFDLIWTQTGGSWVVTTTNHVYLQSGTATNFTLKTSGASYQAAWALPPNASTNDLEICTDSGNVECTASASYTTLGTGITTKNYGPPMTVSPGTSYTFDVVTHFTDGSQSNTYFNCVWQTSNSTWQCLDGLVSNLQVQNGGPPGDHQITWNNPGNATTNDISGCSYSGPAPCASYTSWQTGISNHQYGPTASLASGTSYAGTIVTHFQDGATTTTTFNCLWSAGSSNWSCVTSY